MNSSTAPQEGFALPAAATLVEDSKAGWIEVLADCHPAPSSDVPSCIQFGVVGEGNNKRILAFNASAVSTFLSDDDVGGPEEWTCQACQYQNGDILNRICGMCGTRRKKEGRLPSNMGSRTEITPLMRDISRKESLRKLLSKKLSGISIELDFETTTEREASSCEKFSNDLTRDLAKLTVNEVGGWNCPDCTFVNVNAMHLTCDVCGRQKPPNELPTTTGYASVADFLTSSMRSFQDGFHEDPHVEAFLKIEDMAHEKGRMALMVEEQKAILDAAKRHSEQGYVSTNNYINMSEVNVILEEGQETFYALWTLYEEEKKEYDEMVALQAQREQLIEETEGTSPRVVLAQRASRPGAQQISRATLEWLGQQRMLDDWRFQLDQREMEIKNIQEQQQQTLGRVFG
jgi:hypothetical protein